MSHAKCECATVWVLGTVDKNENGDKLDEQVCDKYTKESGEGEEEQLHS